MFKNNTETAASEHECYKNTPSGENAGFQAGGF